MAKTLRPARRIVDNKNTVRDPSKSKVPSRHAVVLSEAIRNSTKSIADLAKSTMGETSVERIKALRDLKCDPLPQWWEINQLLIELDITPAQIGQHLKIAKPSPAAGLHSKS